MGILSWLPDGSMPNVRSPMLRFQMRIQNSLVAENVGTGRKIETHLSSRAVNWTENKLNPGTDGSDPGVSLAGGEVLKQLQRPARGFCPFLMAYEIFHLIQNYWCPDPDIIQIHPRTRKYRRNVLSHWREPKFQGFQFLPDP